MHMRLSITGATKRDTLAKIKHYYECIKAHATSIVSHREKQTFLKVIYENFYKAYNPKGADRLGIVYTPGEIIDFMIRSTDTLLHRHFGRGLADTRHDRKEPVSKQPDLLPDEVGTFRRNVRGRLGEASLPLDKPALKPRLKALKDTGEIEIDATTTLRGIPPEAWDYKLGNRSALEWVLDQWKEHKISDPTVAEKFNTYRFADYKEPVIDLLHRVCTVSVETMRIIRSLDI
jgi:predicted helicase